MNYTLTVIETSNKASKFLYRVVDENKNIVSERRSNRVYVACCVRGENYFGRLDLADKWVKLWIKNNAGRNGWTVKDVPRIAYLESAFQGKQLNSQKP